MPATILVEGFGRLSPVANVEGVIDAEEEDLYSVFRARSELMSWYGADRSTGRPLAWAHHEAEETPGTDGSRIGYAQVGLEFGGVDVVLRLPALIQCFDDSLRRFGIVDMSAIQVTASGVDRYPGSCLGDLVSQLNWFNTGLKAGANAVITFNQEMLGGHMETELFPILQGWRDRPFAFGPMATVPEELLIRISATAPHLRALSAAHLGLPVALPEWTASAAGWALAVAIDAARAVTPDVSDFAVRISRVQ